MDRIKDFMRGAVRSWTVWFSVLLAALPDVLPLVQANFKDVAPYIPDGLEAPIMRGIALVVLLLRLKTTVSLVEKRSQK